MSKRTEERLPGCIYPRSGGRFWWAVKLSGEKARKLRPLIPHGQELATTDRDVAEQVAWEMYRAAQRQQAAGDTDTWDGTVGGLAAMYRAYAAGTFTHADGTPTKQVTNIEYATQPLVDYYASMPAEDFGPKALKELRMIWIKDGLCRSTINDRVRIIQAAFRWAVGEELIHSTQANDIGCVEAIHQNRKVEGLEVKQPRKVGAIDPKLVLATIQDGTSTFKAMVEIQMLTGMRSTELLTITPGAIDRTDPEAWIYNVAPEYNKNEHRNDAEGTHDRQVPLVGRVQDLLRPFLLRPADKFCFCPAEAEAQRLRAVREARTSRLDKNGKPYARKYPNREARAYGERFDRDSYRKSILHAIKKVNRSLEDLIKSAMNGCTPEAKRKAYDALKVPHWHPHQLRHTAGTLARKALGLEASGALLGHKEMSATQIYAEKDKALAIKVAQLVGKQLAAIPA